MKVIIEALGNQIVSDYCFKGWLGATNEGHDVEILSLPKASLKQDQLKQERPMPIGSVGYMEYFFDLYDIEKPKPLQATSCLYNYTNEKAHHKIVEKRVDLVYPTFVKPLLDIKKFTGFVATSDKDWDLYPELDGWDGPYFCNKPFDGEIMSEWRCFVHKGKLINCSYYDGVDPIKFPNNQFINFLIQWYYNSPVAYTLDVAVIGNNNTTLIEVNDMWAIGPYGCNETDYFKMLKDRWNEIQTKGW